MALLVKPNIIPLLTPALCFLTKPNDHYVSIDIVNKDFADKQCHAMSVTKANVFVPRCTWQPSNELMYVYYLHNYIGPAWMVYSIPYLTDVPGSWTSLKWTPRLQRSSLASGSCAERLALCILYNGGRPLSTGVLQRMLRIFWMNENWSLIEEGGEVT